MTIADRICYVAFDGVFSSYALDVSEKIPVYSVVNSLLDALDADKVQITVGGKDRLDTFGKKMELYHFYERNSFRFHKRAQNCCHPEQPVCIHCDKYVVQYPVS